MSNKPTIKQKLFVKEYIKNKGNGTRAIEIAYPNVKTEKGRGVMACRLLANDRINNMIDKELEKEGLSKDFVVKETKKVLGDCEHARDKLTALRLLGDLGGYTKHTQTVVQQGALFQLDDTECDRLRAKIKAVDVENQSEKDSKQSPLPITG